MTPTWSFQPCVLAEAYQIGRTMLLFYWWFISSYTDHRYNSWIFFCPTGDILGSSLNNLDHLVRMPWGCGEQNMVNFAPNIYVLKYLQTVNQLTKQLETKAKQYMVSGWCSYAVDWKNLELYFTKEDRIVWRRGHSAFVNVSVRCGLIIWVDFVGSSRLFLSEVLLWLLHFFVCVIKGIFILFPRHRHFSCFSWSLVFHHLCLSSSY